MCPHSVLASGEETARSHDVMSLSLQTILVGDSGVGKTSLLVQYDQGKFIPGSFAATVGIGFTVSPRALFFLVPPHPPPHPHTLLTSDCAEALA